MKLITNNRHAPEFSINEKSKIFDSEGTAVSNQCGQCRSGHRRFFMHQRVDACFIYPR